MMQAYAGHRWLDELLVVAAAIVNHAAESEAADVRHAAADLSFGSPKRLKPCSAETWRK